MFKNLLNFSHVRTAKEAVGFYIAYLLFIVIGSMLSAALLGVATGNEDSFEFGVRVGGAFAIIAVEALAFSILNKRGLLKNFGYILLAVISGLLAYLGGALLGLIAVSFLSTRKK